MKQRVLSGAILVVFFAAVIVFNRSFPLALNIVVALISATAVLELIRALGLLRKLGFVSGRSRPIEVCDLTGLRRYLDEEG